MWKQIQRSITTPLKLTRMIGRIVALLEEQNRLLRELHLAEYGRHAHTPTRATSPITTGTTPRLRSGSDVWQRTPLSLQKQEDNTKRIREARASQPTTLATDGSSPESPLGGLELPDES